MSETESEFMAERAEEQPALPAVGLVASADNGEALAQTVLRATQRNHEVLVTYQGEAPVSALEVAEIDGVRLIEPPSQIDDLADLRQAVSIAARALSVPGVLFHGVGGARIDYEASTALLEDEVYCVDPVLESKTRDDQPLRTLVAIPAYNEGTTIGEVVAEARNYADEVVVVDDGSEDDTATQAKSAGATVIEHDENSGYGASLQTAFQEAVDRNVAELVILDGDGQHDPSDIPLLVDTLRNRNADIAIGSRFAPSSETVIPHYRQLGISVVNLLTNLSLGVVRSESWVDDTQSGYRAYNRQAIKSLAKEGAIGDRMSASTDILYHAHHNNFVMEEVGTTIDYDVEDGSSHNPLSHGIHLVMNILKTVERDRPITFLGIPGFVTTFAGLGFGYWTILNYMNSGGFPIGLAVTSMFLVLAGIFACFTAIILHSLSTQLDG